MLAVMREHPGGSVQHRAMFIPLPTGRLAPFRSHFPQGIVLAEMRKHPGGTSQ